MRFLNALIIGILLLATSCGGANKSLKKGRTISSEKGTVIREVEEKLASNNDPSRYFVIIGSFRNPDNARKYQEQLLADGFNPATLKNENGLLRVSVLATNDIVKARNEVKKIWAEFPEYSDTWLLIQKY